jgi:hypothetical protein
VKDQHKTPTRLHRLSLFCMAAALTALSVTACGSSSPARDSPTPANATGTITPAGSGSSDSAPPDATTSAISNSSSTAGGSVADGIGHPVNVCALLPTATVAQVTGEPITIAKEDDTLSANKIYDCTYTSADGTASVTVDVKAQNAAIAYNAELQANGSGAHPITGLGDKAFSAITGVDALFGNVAIVVSNLQSDDAAESLIRTLQPKL